MLGGSEDRASDDSPRRLRSIQERGESNSSSLKARVLSSARWSVGARVVQQALTYGAFLVLARLLTPTDFGLVGMVTVVMGFATIFTDLGFSTALVQAPNLRRAEVAGALALVGGAGALLSLSLFIGAPALSAFYSEPSVTELARLMCVVFLFASLSIVPRALLQRQLAFRRLALVDTFSSMVAAASTILLAWHGLGPRALVAGTVLSSLLSCLLCLALARRDLLPSLVRPEWPGRILHQGAHLTGFNIINYWARNADNLLVGRWIGADALGIYSRAYNLMLVPYSQVTSVLSGVVVAAMASLQGDPARARVLFMRASGVLSFVSFPLSVGLFVSSGPFVQTLLGERWLAVVPVLRILALVGLFQTICSPLGWIAQSQGRAEVQSKWGLFAGTLVVMAIGIGAYTRTLSGVAFGYLAVNVILTYPALKTFGPLIQARPADLLRPCLPPLVCSGAMALVVLVVASLLRQRPSWIVLLVQVGSGAAVYGLLAWALRLAALRDFLDTVRARRSS
jgi:PST family polysaccharide transporter